ncbi:MAG: hypothetical protein NUV56_01185 [Candidatus Uhrbacteria bacterium]|nr:hypothetical protein [Candidatus Uhrbacteria bacterium]
MPRGVILIYIVLILGGASLAATAMLARSGINAFADSSESAIAQTTRAEVFGCLDEVLIQLQKDNDFAQATVTTGFATCQLTVTTPTAGERTVTTTLTEGSITRRVLADVTLSPFAVTQVIEE